MRVEFDFNESGQTPLAIITGGPVYRVTKLIYQGKAFDSEGEVATYAAQGSSDYPKMETINGVQFKLLAPISPGWKPSTSAWLFGHLPGTYVNDPASPAGTRSPAGFPMYNGRVLYADSTYASDAEVEAMINAPPPPPTPEVNTYTGSLDPDTLSLANWRYYFDYSSTYQARIGQIFTKLPIPRDPATGRLYTVGEIANTKPDPGPLANV